MAEQQERYYVVSERELQNVIGLRALLSSVSTPQIRTEYLEAEAACRAREVVEDISGGWMEVGKR